MDDLPTNVRTAFEKYINGYKKEAFELITPGTKYHAYLCIIESIKTAKGRTTQKIKDMIERFK